jgi:hypothetical protein
VSRATKNIFFVGNYSKTQCCAQQVALLVGGPRMPNSSTDPVQPRPREYDQPVFWFVLLERALDAGDLAAAAHAQQEMARLGYVVKPPRRRRLAYAR